MIGINGINGNPDLFNSIIQIFRFMVLSLKRLFLIVSRREKYFRWHLCRFHVSRSNAGVRKNTPRFRDGPETWIKLLL